MDKQKTNMLILYNNLSNNRMPLAEFKQILNIIDTNKQQRIRRYQTSAQRNQSLIGLLLVEQGMHLFGQQGFSLRDIYYNEQGKPVTDYPVYFNISHSENRVVCVLSDTQNVAIDIEKIRQVHARVKQRYLNNETNDLRAIRTWTAKESMIKLIDYLTISDIPTIKLHGEEAFINNISCYSKAVNIAPGYVCSVACHRKPMFITKRSIRFT